MKKLLLLALALILVACSTNGADVNKPSTESPTEVAKKFCKAYEDIDLVSMNPFMKTLSSEESIKKSADIMTQNPNGKKFIQFLVGNNYQIEKEEIASDGKTAVVSLKADRYALSTLELVKSQTNLDVLAIADFLQKPKNEQDKIFFEKFMKRMEKVSPNTVDIKMNLVLVDEKWKVDDMDKNTELFKPILEGMQANPQTQ